MDEAFLNKRISQTETEIFPLDRLLPLESVYSIFEREYKKSDDKNLFFKDRKFQRLREGYFSLFVAISLTDTSPSQESHYLIFPSSPNNDVHISYRVSEEDGKKPKFISYEFDIKEFTNFSPNFEDFIKKSVIPRIGIYNIAVPSYRKITGVEVKPLIDYLQSKNLDSKIWFLGSPTEEGQGYTVSSVSIVDKDGLVYQKTLDLDDWIDKKATPTVFHDTLNFKRPTS